MAEGEMFAGIFDSVKGTFSDVTGFFDSSLENIGIGSAEDGEDGGLSTLSAAAMSAFSSGDKEQGAQFSTKEGQVAPGGSVQAGSSRAVSSVRMADIERDWSYKLREFAQIK